jgi:hypothetical protein
VVPLDEAATMVASGDIVGSTPGVAIAQLLTGTARCTRPSGCDTEARRMGPSMPREIASLGCECIGARRRHRAAAKGKVRTSVGVSLPFEITGYVCALALRRLSASPARPPLG